jgi:hypothetical protein
MQVLTRLVTTLLVLTLGGGAQYCLASCAIAETKVATEKPTCPRCEKHESSSKPTPTVPSQRCQAASQDRVTPDHHTAPPAPMLVGIIENDLAPLVATTLSSHTPVEATHGPPGDLLHQFCLLLI